MEWWYVLDDMINWLLPVRCDVCGSVSFSLFRCDGTIKTRELDRESMAVGGMVWYMPTISGGIML